MIESNPSVMMGKPVVAGTRLTVESLKLLCDEGVDRPSSLVRIARRKLDQLNQAAVLDDLRVPPGNQLEALKADRRGQHAIRINDQYRVCFVWAEHRPERVEITDYH